MAKTTNLYAKVEYPNYGYDSDVKAVIGGKIEVRRKLMIVC